MLCPPMPTFTSKFSQWGPIVNLVDSHVKFFCTSLLFVKKIMSLLYQVYFLLPRISRNTTDKSKSSDFDQHILTDKSESEISDFLSSCHVGQYEVHRAPHIAMKWNSTSTVTSFSLSTKKNNTIQLFADNLHTTNSPPKPTA